MTRWSFGELSGLATLVLASSLSLGLLIYTVTYTLQDLQDWHGSVGFDLLIGALKPVVLAVTSGLAAFLAQRRRQRRPWNHVERRKRKRLS